MIDLRRIIVRGRVQGVGFRAFVERQAARRGLEGWVRNCRDGSVEAVFQGPSDAVAAAISACSEGPLGARVDAVDECEVAVDALAMRNTGEAFSVLATA